MATVAHKTQKEVNGVHPSIIKTFADAAAKAAHVANDNQVGGFFYQTSGTGAGLNFMVSQSGGTATWIVLGQTSPSIMRFGNSVAGNSTSARFMTVPANAGAVTSNTRPDSNPVAGKAGNLTRFAFFLETALATADLTVTVQINGTDTAAVVTLAHGNTVATAWTGSISVVETDKISVKIVATAADATTSNPHGMLTIS